MIKKITALCVVAIIATGFFVYEKHIRGIITPDEIYADVLGRDKSNVFGILGSPRGVEDWSDKIEWAFWQGRESGGWLYQVWFVNGYIAHISIVYDIFPDIERLKISVGAAQEWHLGTVIGLDSGKHEAWLTEDRSTVIYDTGVSVQIGNGESFLWE